MLFQIAPVADLYRDGGFFDDPGLLAANDSPQGRGAASVSRRPGTVYEAASYERGPYEIHTDDAVFRSQLTEIFEGVRASYKKIVATVAVEFSTGFVRDSAIYVPAGETGLSVFYPTYRPNDRPAIQLIDSDAAEASDVEALPSTGRRLLYLSSVGSFNYGHWIIDDLPKLKFLFDDPQPTTVVIQSFPGMDEIRRDTIHCLCREIDVDVLFVDPLKLLSFTDLHYVTPVSYHPFLKNPEALAYVRSAALSRVAAKSPGPRRLFVRRRRSRGRHLTDSMLVEAFLLANGFVSIDPEDLDFEAQVAAFRDAELVVGVMCAAMCNTVFSSPRATVVLLSPDGWVEPFYWDLASILGHKYIAVHGPRVKLNAAPHLDDFGINFGAFKKIISREIEVIGR